MKEHRSGSVTRLDWSCTHSCSAIVSGSPWFTRKFILLLISLKSWLRLSYSSVCAARCEFTKQTLVLYRSNLTPAPPLFPWKLLVSPINDLLVFAGHLCDLWAGFQKSKICTDFWSFYAIQIESQSQSPGESPGESQGESWSELWGKSQSEL